MPSLLDSEQQAFADQAPPDMAGALGGVPTPGATDPTGGVAQAKDDTVARGLLGDELVNRYGDVLGLRKETWKDFWRDFGNELGGRGNAERIKQRVIDQYQTREREERLAAQQRDEQDRSKLQAFTTLVTKMKDIPKGHRQGILKAGLAQLGMDSTPEAQKLLADVENFDAEQILTPEVLKLWDENPQAALAEIAKGVTDPLQLIAIKKGLLEMDAKRQEIQNKILEGDRKKGIQQRDEAKARRELALRLSMMQITDEATGEKRRLTPEEIVAHVNTIYPPSSDTGAEPVGIPQDVPPEVSAETDPMAGATSMSTPTTSGGGPTSTPTTAPVGIPQAAAPAPAGRLKKITGTVRRVE